MSKEVQIVAWCDGEHERPVRAIEEREAAFGRAAARVLDLCAEHVTQVDLVVEMFARGVTRADQDRVAERIEKRTRITVDQKVPCPEPGCVRTFRNRAGLSQHTYMTHHKRLTEYPDEGRPLAS